MDPNHAMMIVIASLSCCIMRAHSSHGRTRTERPGRLVSRDLPLLFHGLTVAHVVRAWCSMCLTAARDLPLHVLTVSRIVRTWCSMCPSSAAIDHDDSQLLLHTHLLTLVGVMIFLYTVLMLDETPRAAIVPSSMTRHVENNNNY